MEDQLLRGCLTRCNSADFLRMPYDPTLPRDAARQLRTIATEAEQKLYTRRSADVIVTDGFTGNVALKTLEGAVMGLAGLVFGVIDEPGAPWAEAADALKLRLLEAAAAAPARQHRRRDAARRSRACA